MAHANTSHPLYVAAMAGNTNHMSPWARGEDADAHKRWLAALGPSSSRGPFAWQTSQQRHPPPGSGEQTSTSTSTSGATGSHEQHSHNVSSDPYTAHNSNEAHEAWLKTYQSVWGNSKHAGGHFPSRRGHGPGAWSGPWSQTVAAAAAGGRQHHMMMTGGGPGPRWMGGPMPWTWQAQGECDESKNPKSFIPDIDVLEMPESYSVQVSLPGAKKEDVKVSWDPSTYELRIEGVVSRSVGNDKKGVEEEEEEEETEAEGKSGPLRLRERQTGKFSRVVYLGSQVDGELIEGGVLSAGMEDGVLRITMPRQGGNGKGVKEITIL
ncbi:hypothetical protein E4U17_003132 [Claviceps sp. LM77 group G4]|nr:hypothetical protein E4U17_003132 [Claviceps sp. LM77 group G4]